MQLIKPFVSLVLHDSKINESVQESWIKSIEMDSRNVEPGALFVAIRGTRQDANQYIAEALQRGAIAALTDDLHFFESNTDMPLIYAPDARLAVGLLAGAFYGSPSKAMKVLAVTGTNGKTTCVYLLEHVLNALSQSCGVMGTIQTRYPGFVTQSAQTTANSIEIHRYLARMKAAGCDWAAMEVSSHALDQKRISAVQIAGAIFTNLTQDHLDYHVSMEQYYQAKRKLFENLGPASFSAINVDDPYGERLVREIKTPVIRYGLAATAHIKATHIQRTRQGSRFSVEIASNVYEVQSPLIGQHNIYNYLSVISLCYGLGLDMKKVCLALGQFGGVPGRLQKVSGEHDFDVYVDYAHTPDGLLNVLESLEPYKGQGRIITLFGCGGDRDKSKRPKMADVAQRLSDFIIITSDNPRSEDPYNICQDIVSGFPKDYKNYSVSLDRKRAIRQALLMAREGDIVLLAGKGHESVQVLKDASIPFNDSDEARRVLRGD